MPAALELGLQPNLYHAVDQLPAQEIRGQAKDIGIVVSAAHLCGNTVMARGRADAANLVGNDAHSDAGAAHEDAAFNTAVADGLCHLNGIIGIIDALAARRAHVHNLVTQSLQERADTPFDLKAAVVATDCDSHVGFVSTAKRGHPSFLRAPDGTFATTTRQKR